MIRATLFDMRNKEFLEALEWYKPGIRFNKRHFKTLLLAGQYHAERGKLVHISIETDNKRTLGMTLFYVDNNRVQVIYRENLKPVSSLRISKGEYNEY